MPWCRALVAATLLLVLGSCTRIFLVTASVEAGQLIFQSKDDDRTFYPWCWDNFTIVNAQGRAVWEFDVPHGAFNGKDACGPNFPIRYGQAPERAETMVPAQPLEVGQLYVIDGHAAGMLEGAFKIERIEGRLKVRNFKPDNAEALSIRNSYLAWQQAHDPPRISPTPTSNANFEVEEPPETIPQNSQAGPSGTDSLTWVLHPDAWWNLPSLSYQSLTGSPTSFNLWCRYTGGPIYARFPPPAIKGEPVTLESDPERLAVRSIGAGNPNRRDRVDAIIAYDSPILRNFAETGELTLEVAQRKLVLSAIDEKERAVVRRFFQLCAEPRTTPSPIVEARNN